jgi:hypothetical protein
MLNRPFLPQRPPGYACSPKIRSQVLLGDQSNRSSPRPERGLQLCIRYPLSGIPMVERRFRTSTAEPKRFKYPALQIHRIGFLLQMRLTNTSLCLTLSLLGLASAQRFVRFIATDGKEYTGDAILPPNETDAAHSKQAKVITGDILGDFTITQQVKVGLIPSPAPPLLLASRILILWVQTIKTLLSPLAPEKTRTVSIYFYF